MAYDIPSDPNVYKKMIQKVQLRMLRSSMWSDNQRQTWVRMYKIYRRIQDGQASGDEYSIFLGYAFAIVEQINSKVTEPMLNMGIPFAVFPTHQGDAPKADNFAQVCRDFYAKPNVQDQLRKSKKEMIITGNRWEVDEWLHVEVPGKGWGKIPRKVSVIHKRPDGTPFESSTVEMVDGEVPRKVVKHYGFNTRYTSVFNMFPEPDRPTIDTGQRTDMSYCGEDMGELALEAMAREVYVDPIDKMTKPLFDFSRLIHDAGKAAQTRYERILEGRPASEDKMGPVITPVHDWSFNSDWGQQDKDTVYPTEGQVDRSSSEDRDKIWVVRQYEAGEILTIAQGKYIIHRKRDPWHVPGLHMRIENYTTDPEFIYGVGAIEPIEDELYELNDIHSLSMDNFFRLVHRMIAVKDAHVISYDDFKRRAGGIIRISEDAPSAAGAIVPLPGNNVQSEMIAAESNNRGIIEFESSNLDGSPGVRGTKQDHKTKGGLEQVVINTQTRFITMQASALSNEAKRGLSMQELFNQFAFEKMDYRLLNEDGSTAYAQFNKEDVYTEGRPFLFQIEIDPTWGNTQQQRQDAQDLFELGIKYEELRKTMNDPTMKKVVLSELFEDLLRKHGRRDLSGIFVKADGEVSPEQELQTLMQGGTVECKGDLQHHMTTHLLQAQSLNLKKAIKAGKADPQTVTNLMRLIAQDKAQLVAFLNNPQAAAAERLQKAGMKHPGVDQ